MITSRRRFLQASLGLSATALGLSACNASADPAGPASAGAGAGPDAGAFPVTITHRYGETVIEQAPTRVVTYGLKEQDDLLAVGIVPVAATKWLEFPEGDGIVGPWATEALGGAPLPQVLDSADGVPFEAIAALQPDLVIALYSGLTEADYTKLSAITKVVVPPEGYVDYGIPWDVQAEIVGRAVGRSAQMTERIAASKQQVSDVAAANPAFAQATAMVITPYEGLYVYGSEDPRVRLMTSLGFQLPPGFDALFEKDTQTFGGNISRENAEIIDVGTLICFADEGAQQKEIETSLFRSQAVSKEGRAVWLRTTDRATIPFSFLTVLSLPYLLEQLVPRVVAAVDGDPATSTEQTG